MFENDRLNGLKGRIINFQNFTMGDIVNLQIQLIVQKLLKKSITI